ncbi:NepR family anti-sigma factor [Shimia sp. SDUM112013]|uniref:NepR family anti-sigma factor n=1 Tax=Shimia sp. SDUM112013 TaxID=3136160 RepID=UPI0032EEC74F
MVGETGKSSLEEQIDENLRKVFQKDTEEPVPDRFVDLLKQLKEREQANDK